jgi:tetratricopeptide (TPR) repeat protein
MSQKLRGIYDALDHSNYKNALKLCATLLKKEPTHALCKALNAVALERCGRREEALQSCDEALVGTGVDDTVLSTVQVVFKRCRQYSKITQMYEAAWTKDPDNKDYAIALFSASIRECDFAKSQQVATKLYRKFNLQKFLHWVVVSILLQARGKKDAKVLDLAEMMLQKAPVEPLKAPLESLNRSQQYLLLLHLTTLRSKAKFTEALDMMEANKGYFPFEADVLRMRVQLLEESGRLPEAAKEARKLVLLELSNWSASQDYARISFCCPLPEADALPTLRWLPLEAVEFTLPDHGSRLRGSSSK